MNAEILGTIVRPVVVHEVAEIILLAKIDATEDEA
jgi:hypothetical protein